MIIKGRGQKNLGFSRSALLFGLRYSGQTLIFHADLKDIRENLNFNLQFTNYKLLKYQLLKKNSFLSLLYLLFLFPQSSNLFLTSFVSTYNYENLWEDFCSTAKSNKNILSGLRYTKHNYPQIIILLICVPLKQDCDSLCTPIPQLVSSLT